MESLPTNKRVRLNSDDPESISLQQKRFRNNDLLPDSDVFTATPDLESFISDLPPSVTGRETVSGDCQPDLGFLLEASDDQLGLPPPADLTLTTGVSAESIEAVLIEEVWRLEDEMLSYEYGYGFGYAGDDAYIDTWNEVEYVALDALFDYTDVGFESPDFSQMPETMPATG